MVNTDVHQAMRERPAIRARHGLRAGAAMALFMLLSSCQGTGSALDAGVGGANSQGQATTRKLTPNPQGTVIGTAGTRVALLLPKSAPGNGGVIAQQFENAARLAMRDFGQAGIQLVIKNTAGQAADAQNVARQAIDEGSSLILGPIFAGNVSAASAFSQPSGVPMIAFSSDTTLARRNVYLLSFAPRADVRRTINYAVSQGRNSIVALLPNTPYGNLVEKSLRSVLNSGGGTLIAVAKYDRTAAAIEQAAQSVAAAASGANAIYVPDDPRAAGAALNALRSAGVPLGQMKVLGSGQWESAKLSSPLFRGAWHAGRDRSNFGAFAAQYKAAYGSAPSPNAGLAYDAVSMAAGLIRRHSQNPFASERIESRNGFSGVNGIFRLRSDGKAERGLVVYEVRGGQSAVISAAPTAFGAGF
ncbi:MAG: penicillin-binding protein activator [Pseudomonadota bacterium]